MPLDFIYDASDLGESCPVDHRPEKAIWSTEAPMLGQ